MKILLLFLILQGRGREFPLGGLKKEGFMYFSEVPISIFGSASPNQAYLVDENYKIEPGDVVHIKFFGNFNSDFELRVPSTGIIVITSKEAPGYLVNENYKIEPGDVVHIKFFGNFNSNFELRVPSTGIIVITSDLKFVLGKFYAKGKTVKELEDEIRERLKEKYFETDVVVNIAKIREILVHIGGDVPYPGYYIVSSLTRVTGALVKSGLIGSEVMKGKIYLLRNGKEIEIKIKEYFNKGNLDENPYLKNGDIIIFNF